MPIARNIKYLRKKHGLTQKDLADQLGYKSQSTIQKWEQKETFPPMNKVKEMSALFSCELSTMFDVDLEKEEREEKEREERQAAFHPTSVEIQALLKFRSLPSVAKKMILASIDAAYEVGDGGEQWEGNTS